MRNRAGHATARGSVDDSAEATGCAAETWYSSNGSGVPNFLAAADSVDMPMSSASIASPAWVGANAIDGARGFGPQLAARMIQFSIAKSSCSGFLLATLTQLSEGGT